MYGRGICKNPQGYTWNNTKKLCNIWLQNLQKCVQTLIIIAINEFILKFHDTFSRKN